MYIYIHIYIYFYKNYLINAIYCHRCCICFLRPYNWTCFKEKIYHPVHTYTCYVTSAVSAFCNPYKRNAFEKDILALQIATLPSSKLDIIKYAQIEALHRTNRFSHLSILKKSITYLPLNWWLIYILSPTPRRYFMFPSFAIYSTGWGGALRQGSR